MVMMEQFENKSTSFIKNGIIAIALKLTKDSMQIVENIEKIGFILFHTRKDVGQHLYPIKKQCVIRQKDEIDDLIYKNISTSSVYILVVFDSEKEIDTTDIHSSKRGFNNKLERYDAQYAQISDL